jgi:RNA polymerase sigma factor (sigma-70 family)
MTPAPHGAALDTPDDQLLPAVADGDEAAFRILYRRHTPRLRVLVLRVLGGHDADAEDAVQESWVRAVASVGDFRGDSQFGRWLNGIGIRVAWEVIRRRHSTDPIRPDDEPAVDPPDSAERLDLEDALRRLPDDQRAVVVLHDVEGYGHDEIAASLGVAIGTSRSHLSRARRALRAMLCSYERIVK